MHTVDLLERALRVIESLGYRIRQDWLDCPQGSCEIRGQKWLFLDLASGPAEHLHLVADTLAREVVERDLDLDPALLPLLAGRRAA